MTPPRRTFALLALSPIVCAPVALAHAPYARDAVHGTTPTVNGTLAAGEWADATVVTWAVPGGVAEAYLKEDASNLYVAFRVPDATSSNVDQVLIYLDADHSAHATPQANDRIYIHQRDGQRWQMVGTGSSWTWQNASTGWASAMATSATEWRAEYRIGYAELGVAPGTWRVCGFNVGTRDGGGFFPWIAAALWDNPSTWGDLFSTDLWGLPATVAVSGTPSVGSIVPLDLTAPYDANLPYLAAVALGTAPGIPLPPPDPRTFRLNPDPLFYLSIAGGPLFPNFAGALNAAGTATAGVSIPPIPGLVGLTFHAGFFTSSFSSPTGIRSLSRPTSITIVP